MFKVCSSLKFVLAYPTDKSKKHKVILGPSPSSPLYSILSSGFSLSPTPLYK
jgi:hypothetical protein